MHGPIIHQETIDVRTEQVAYGSHCRALRPV
jgi:hypothetical protein